MIKSEKIKRIVEISRGASQFTTWELLNRYGFNNSDLNMLVKDGFMIRDDGRFFITQKTKKYEKNEKLSDLSSKISKGKYREALTIMESFKDDGTINLADYNFFLILMSFVTELPDSTLDYINSLERKDLLDISRTEYGAIINILPSNKRVKSIFAEFRLLDITHSQDDFYDRIVSDLLYRGRDNYIDFENDITNCFKDKNYSLALELLNSNAQNTNLLIKTTCILIKIYESVNKFGIVPKKTDEDAHSLYELAIHGHLEKILYVVKKSKDITYWEFFFTSILKDLDDAIGKTKQNASENGEPLLQVSVLGMCALYDATNYFKMGKVSEGSSTISDYLKSIGKEKYTKFMMEEIKRSIIEDDEMFYVPFKILAIIENGNPSMNVLISKIETKVGTRNAYVYRPVKSSK